MASELIATALKTADETKAIAFGDDVLADTGKIFAAEFPGACRGRDVLFSAGILKKTGLRIGG